MPAASYKGNNLLRLRVHPNTTRNEVAGFSGGIWQVRIAAPPVKGKANKELLVFLSQVLGVSQSSLNIVRGYTSHSKTISISGLSQEEISQHLSDST